MRTGISITLTSADRRRLEAISKDRNAAQKHAWRAAILLLSADGIGTVEIMRRTANHRRLLEPIGNIPPAEAEANFYAVLEQPAMAA